MCSPLYNVVPLAAFFTLTYNSMKRLTQVLQNTTGSYISTNAKVLILQASIEVIFIQTWGNYQLVNYFLPISHYNWQLRIIGH